VSQYDLITLDVLFILRKTFQGGAEILNHFFPQHSLATMRDIIAEHRERFVVLDLTVDAGEHASAFWDNLRRRRKWKKRS
jgi:hypothetical protein